MELASIAGGRDIGGSAKYSFPRPESCSAVLLLTNSRWFRFIGCHLGIFPETRNWQWKMKRCVLVCQVKMPDGHNFGECKTRLWFIGVYLSTISQVNFLVYCYIYRYLVIVFLLSCMSYLYFIWRWLSLRMYSSGVDEIKNVNQSINFFSIVPIDSCHPQLLLSALRYHWFLLFEYH